jgi:hypothetical protein
LIWAKICFAIARETENSLRLPINPDQVAYDHADRSRSSRRVVPYSDCVRPNEVQPPEIGAIAEPHTNADGNPIISSTAERETRASAVTRPNYCADAVFNVAPVSNQGITSPVAENDAAADSGEAFRNALGEDNSNDASTETGTDGSPRPGETDANACAGSGQTNAHAGATAGYQSLSRSPAGEIQGPEVPHDRKWG